MKKLMWLTILGFGSAIFAALEWFDVNVSGGYVGRDGSVDWRFVGCVNHTTDGGACADFNKHLYIDGKDTGETINSTIGYCCNDGGALVDAGYNYCCGDAGATDGCSACTNTYTITNGVTLGNAPVFDSPCENPKEYFKRYPENKDMDVVFMRCMREGIKIENVYDPSRPAVVSIPQSSFDDVILRLDGKEYKPRDLIGRTKKDRRQVNAGSNIRTIKTERSFKVCDLIYRPNGDPPQCWSIEDAGYPDVGGQDFNGIRFRDDVCVNCEVIDRMPSITSEWNGPDMPTITPRCCEQEGK